MEGDRRRPDESERHNRHEERLAEFFRDVEASGFQAAMERLAQDIAAELAPGDLTLLSQTGEAKRWDERAEAVFASISDLMDEEPPLVSLTNKKQTFDEYVELIGHVFAMWVAARDLFDSESYSLATFMAIACIEETGKVGIAKMQAQLFIDADWKPPNVSRTQMRSHQRKHFLAAAQGAFINTRLDRIVGLGHVAKFLDDVESGAIEPFRQSCLYAERKTGHLHDPALSQLS